MNCRAVGVVPAQRRVGTLLRWLGFRRFVTPPRHPGYDAAAQAPAAPSPPSTTQSFRSD